MGLEDLPSEGLRRSPAFADPWETLVEVPSAAQAVVLMALEVKIAGPNPQTRVAQDPDEAVLHPKLFPLAERTAHGAQISGPDQDRLRSIDAFDFKLRQSHYNGICGVHGEPDFAAEEFSLDGFRELHARACANEGRPARVLARYPFLAGEHPEDLPGLEELLNMAQDAVVVATADLLHHGRGYGTAET